MGERPRLIAMAVGVNRSNSPTTEGQATAAYLVRLLKPLGVSVSRIGMGIPIGSELEFIDEATMVESIEGRREI